MSKNNDYKSSDSDSDDFLDDEAFFTVRRVDLDLPN